ncbi:MAG: hypothetical protein K8W52_32500 [Deltaproteobacteria bacterium]|nr:hypothetical protein [Deltaproteobacteria bacterium]
MRLGEILIEDGAVGAAELAAALGERGLAASPRLGAVLIRRGAVVPDAIARALARQHGVPAALDRHLSARDPALEAALPADLAMRLTALPLARTRLGDQYALVVCLRDPRDPIALELIARAAGEPIVPAVASEAVLVPAVRSAYESHHAPADDSVDVVFDDTSGPVIEVADAPPARDPMAGGALTLVSLDEVGVARDPSQWLEQRPPTGPLPVVAPTPLGTAVRNANATAAEPGTRAPTLPPTPIARPPTLPPGLVRPPTAPSVDDSWRITGEQAAVAPPDEPPPRISRAEVHAQLAAASTRDAIGDAAIAFIAGRYATAAILIVKDGLALGHRGAGALAAPIDTITVPLAQPSVLQVAHDRAAPFLGVPADAGAIQDRALRALGVRPGAELAIAPIVIGKRVVTLALGHTPWPGVAADRALGELVDLAAAMAEAYVRVIRDAKRP